MIKETSENRYKAGLRTAYHSDIPVGGYVRCIRAEVLNAIGVSPFSPQHDRLVQRLAAGRAALRGSSNS